MSLPRLGALAPQRIAPGALVPASRNRGLAYHLVRLARRANVRWQGTSLCGAKHKDWAPYGIGIEPPPDMLCKTCGTVLIRRVGMREESSGE
jgi:hypothetical protein